MVVKKSSWHYKLVSHKKFVQENKEGNQDTINYIVEVVLGIVVYSTLIPFAVVAVLVVSGYDKDNLKYLVTLLIIFASAPIWSGAILSLFGLFTTKKWKELKIQ